MSTTPTYTGDVLLSINTEGDWDINYINGQTEMTDGFGTAVILSTLGEPDFWQNDLTDDPSEKYISEFPDVINNGRVDDKTLKNGIAALKKALQFMIDINAAESIDVTGGVLSVYGLYWLIEIIKGEITGRYTINWEKGVIDIAGIPVFDSREIGPKLSHAAMLNPDLSIQTNPSGEIQLYEFVE